MRIVAPSLADRPAAAKELVEWCAQRLKLEKDATLKARLFYEQGRLYETILEDLEQSARSYQSAHALDATFVPTLTGLARVRSRQGQWEAALAPIKEQIQFCQGPEERAALHVVRAVIFEMRLGKIKEARSEYAQAAEQAPHNSAIVFAQVRLARVEKDWPALDVALAKLAELGESEVPWAASILAEQARVAEYLRKRSDEALALYMRAFEISPLSTASAYAAERLMAQKGKHQDLADLYQQRAELLREPGARAAEYTAASALVLARGGDATLAGKLAELAYEASPDDRAIIRRLVEIYRASGDDEELLSALSRLEHSEREPKLAAELNVLIGKILALRLGRPEEALKVYDKARRLLPADPDCVEALCELYQKQADHSGLYAILYEAEEASDVIAYRVDLLLRMAEVAERHLHRPDKAIAHYQTALGLDPAEQKAFRNAVRLLDAAGRHEEVIELYERAAADADNDEIFFSHLFAIGQLLEHALRDPARAVAAYQRILKRKPEHLGAHFCLQRAARNALLYDVLLESLLQEAGVQKSKSYRLELLHSAAELCADELKDSARALAVYKQVLALEPAYHKTLVALERFYCRNGRPSEQLDTLESLLKQESQGVSRARRLFEMGRIAELQLADKTRALGYYRRAVDDDPAHTQAGDEVARLLAASQKFEDLAQFWEARMKGLPAGEPSAYQWMRLGELYEWTLGRLPQALHAYEEALSNAPGLAVAHAARIRVLEQRADHKKTVMALDARRALTTDPALQLWTQLRAIELLESLEPKPELASEAARQLLAEVPQQHAALATLLRASEPSERSRVVQQILAGLSLAEHQAAVLHDLLRLHETEESGGAARWQVTEQLLTLSHSDLVALRAAELDALSPAHPEHLASVDRRMAEAWESRGAGGAVLAAAHRVRLSEYLEPRNPVQALEQLRPALKADGGSLAAARGMSRIAEAVSEPGLLVEAAAHEAGLVQDGERAARLLVLAAELRQKEGKIDVAIDCLTRALAVWPQSIAAARALHELLSEREEFTQLSATLAQAAESCSDAKIAADHWVEVARLAADRRDDLAEGISVLDRLEKRSRGTLASGLELAELLCRDRQWERAAVQLNKALELNPDAPTVEAVHLRLAEVYHEHLHRLSDASRHLRDVLKHNELHQSALRRLLAIQIKEGAEHALETAKKLVDVSQGKDRAEAYAAQGRLLEKSEQRVQAAQAYASAVAIVGLQPPEPAEQLRHLLDSARDDELGWGGYEKALHSFATQSEPSEHQARVYLELAEVAAKRSAGDAIAHLKNGLALNPNYPKLRVALSQLLRRERRLDEALVEMRHLVQFEPTEPRFLKGLVEVCDGLGHFAESQLAAGALVTLGEANELQQAAWKNRRPNAASLAMGAFDTTMLGETLPEPVSLDVLQLLEQIGPLLGKVFPPHLEQYGVNAKMRIAPRAHHALRPALDRVAHCLGNVDIDLYVSDSETSLRVVLTDPISIVVPSSVMNLTDAEQVFVFASAAANIARGAGAVDALGLDELRLALAAGARLADPAFDAPGVDGAQLAEATRRLNKALPWLSKGRIEEAARRYATAPAVDAARLRKALTESAFRAALILADDLSIVSSMLAGHGALFGLNHEQARAQARRLLGYWVSPQALGLRQAIGQIGG